MPDERVWLPNASGIYTTKSGYAIAKLHNEPHEGSAFNWKQSIWQVDTSPKIKHFLWKANCRALPVGSLLESRGILGASTCKRCGDRETEIHLLLHCPFATKIWDLAPCLFKPSPEVSSVAELLHQCRKMVSLPPLGLGSTPLYPWILWILWTNRNKLQFENRSFTEETSILKAIQDARAWKAAQTHVKMPSLPHHVVSPFAIYQAPNTYTWTSFSDAAWDPITGNCGMGWQLRDANNLIAENSSSHRRFVPSALVAEALAVKAALSAAVSSHVRSLTMYSDSKNLVALLKNQGHDVALKGVLHDIRVLARSLDSISFLFIPRLSNIDADTLAKAALFHLPASAPIVE